MLDHGRVDKGSCGVRRVHAFPARGSGAIDLASGRAGIDADADPPTRGRSDALASAAERTAHVAGELSAPSTCELATEGPGVWRVQVRNSTLHKSRRGGLQILSYLAGTLVV